MIKQISHVLSPWVPTVNQGKKIVCIAAASLIITSGQSRNVSVIIALSLSAITLIFEKTIGCKVKKEDSDDWMHFEFSSKAIVPLFMRIVSTSIGLFLFFGFSELIQIKFSGKSMSEPLLHLLRTNDLKQLAMIAIIIPLAKDILLSGFLVERVNDVGFHCCSWFKIEGDLGKDIVFAIKEGIKGFSTCLSQQASLKTSLLIASIRTVSVAGTAYLAQDIKEEDGDMIKAAIEFNKTSEKQIAYNIISSATSILNFKIVQITVALCFQKYMNYRTTPTSN